MPSSISRTLPRLIIAAPMSGSGKTTIAAGLMAALAARGLQVAPFKVGPDYIDPTYHALAAGRPCHNLDPWMLAPDELAALFASQTAQADVAIIEGVMGLFDGAASETDTGSAAHVARLTDTPVLLVLDARAMAQTAAALILGLCTYDPRVRIGGVILNRVGSARHAAMIQTAISDRLDVPVVGYLPRLEALQLPERHLGLAPTAEPGAWSSWLAAVRGQVEATIDIDQVIALARSARPLAQTTHVALAHPANRHTQTAIRSGRDNLPTIAVARDAAFSFLYPDNLDLLRHAGAKLAFFSPLHDATLPPDTQAIYLCGGFPEVHAAALAQNSAMHGAIRRAGDAGIPIYAECGGLMYLTEGIVDQAGVAYPMAGLLPGCSSMSNKLTLGYRSVRAPANSWLWRAGETARGHEFHYSHWEPLPSLQHAYTLLPTPYHSEPREEGVCLGNVFASYIHLFFRAAPWLPARFVAAARRSRPIQAAQPD